MPKERLEATPDLLRFVFFFGFASSSSESDAIKAAPLERRRRPLGLGLGASVAAVVGSSSSSSELASARAEAPLSLLLRRAGMVCFGARRGAFLGATAASGFLACLRSLLSRAAPSARAQRPRRSQLLLWLSSVVRNGASSGKTPLLQNQPQAKPGLASEGVRANLGVLSERPSPPLETRG